jgi:hypothetical protein
VTELVLSPLSHTWFLDLDGTLVEHNGHLTEGGDTLLDGALEFVGSIPGGDLIILVTSRLEEHRAVTETFLKQSGIRFDHIVFGAPFGERILVNDRKPSGLLTAHAINTERDRAPDVAVRVNESL